MQASNLGCRVVPIATYLSSPTIKTISPAAEAIDVSTIYLRQALRSTLCISFRGKSGDKAALVLYAVAG